MEETRDAKEFHKADNDFDKEAESDVEFCYHVQLFWAIMLGATLSFSAFCVALGAYEDSRSRDKNSVRGAPPLTNPNSNASHEGTSADSVRPPLSDLLDMKRGSIKKNVQFLLDFAVVGHPRTATAHVAKWLSKHEDVKIYEEEIHSLQKGKPSELVGLMYALPEGRHYKRGYRAVNNIVNTKALEALRKYWPETKLVVGVRHPVRWFESYYDFKTRQGIMLPPAETMVGRRFPYKALYHVHLAMLGKTNVTEPGEMKLLGWSEEQPLFMSNEVFLYDASQPFDRNKALANSFHKDLSEFVGLSKPLLREISLSHKILAQNDTIDICNDKYTRLRKELVDNGWEAAEWIRTYFLDLPDVTVSSPQHFNEILQTWQEDPCDQPLV